MPKSNHQPLRALNHYVLGPYLITYDDTVKAEIYSESSYNGIIFYTEDARYDVVNNPHLGPRIIINPRDGGCEDIPFKPATFGFLPYGVTAIEFVGTTKGIANGV